MIDPHAPQLVGLGWPPPKTPAFVLKAAAPARDGQDAHAVFVAEVPVARLLLTDRAGDVLALIQRGVLAYLQPLGCDPAEVIWWCEPASVP